jgi:uncharacterized protein YwgA
MNTQELQLAILHSVISELGDVGKTKLQKLGYFLQEAYDVPTKIPFRMHHYGPYSEALETDIARLRLAGYVKVDADQQGYGFHITKIDSPLEEWKQLIEPFRNSITRMIEEFGNRPVPELELAATIHFVKNLSPGIQKQQAIDKVRALKPKFGEVYVIKIYDELKDKGLLEKGHSQATP